MGEKDSGNIDEGLAKVDQAMSHQPSFGRRIKAFFVLTAIFGIPIAGIYYAVTTFL